MGNINISIKEEAYMFLKTLKTRDKSFSDVILRFKKEKGSKESLMSLFGALKDLDIDWNAKERSMKEFRESFNKEAGKTIKEIEKLRK